VHAFHTLKLAHIARRDAMPVLERAGDDPRVGDADPSQGELCRELGVDARGREQHWKRWKMSDYPLDEALSLVSAQWRRELDARARVRWL
jgi:hypothetical protein